MAPGDTHRPETGAALVASADIGEGTRDWAEDTQHRGLGRKYDT